MLSVWWGLPQQIFHLVSLRSSSINRLAAWLWLQFSEGSWDGSGRAGLEELHSRSSCGQVQCNTSWQVRLWWSSAAAGHSPRHCFVSCRRALYWARLPESKAPLEPWSQELHWLWCPRFHCSDCGTFCTKSWYIHFFLPLEDAVPSMTDPRSALGQSSKLFCQTKPSFMRPFGHVQFLGYQMCAVTLSIATSENVNNLCYWKPWEIHLGVNTDFTGLGTKTKAFQGSAISLPNENSLENILRTFEEFL